MIYRVGTVLFLLILNLSIIFIQSPHKPYEGVDSIIITNADNKSFMSLSPSEGLMEALLHYDIKFPEIVYAQAILETGYFKSNVCCTYNNLFGLYDSRNKDYYRFNHWSESVKAYKDYIQYKYIPPNDYYYFLDSIGYAEDPDYINKVKRIVKQYDERRGK